MRRSRACWSVSRSIAVRLAEDLDWHRSGNASSGTGLLKAFLAVAVKIWPDWAGIWQRSA